MINVWHKKQTKYCGGSAGTGFLLVFAVLMAVFVTVYEFINAYTVKMSLDIELTRAANIAVDLAMSDVHRKDRISSLDAGKATAGFYEYLYGSMGLTSGLEARRGGGELVYYLSIDSLVVETAPPGMRVYATVYMRPAYLGLIYKDTIRLPIRAYSVNRRME